LFLCYSTTGRMSDMAYIRLVIFIQFAVVIFNPVAAYSGDLPSERQNTIQNTYTFGVVPQFEQRKIFRIWLPILSELEQRTGLQFTLKGSAKIPVFEKKFIDGGFDFAYMNPFHILKASNSQGYIPLIRDGDRALKGVLLVKKDSNIKNVNQLHNKTIAFPSPNALGASLLIRADLKNKFNITINPRYVQTHSSVYIHVVKGLLDAGGGVIQTLESQRPSIKKDLEVLYETREIVSHPVAVHPRVPLQHRMLIQKVLLEIAAEEKTKVLFAEIPMKKPVATDMQDYVDLARWGLEKFYVQN